MRILIATIQVPFVRGGAELHAEGLQQAFIQAGHQVELVTIPFKWYPPERIIENILACRLLDLTESSGMTIDRVIGLRFPAYLIPHPNKVLWILHQYRSAYDLWETPLCDLIHYPNGRSVRSAIIHADKSFIPEAKAIYGNSHNVVQRLKRFCGIDAIPLYHPPPYADLFYCHSAQNYLFFPSRINRTKRQQLVIEALAHTREPVAVQFSGFADDRHYADELYRLAAQLNIATRITWLGELTEEQKRDRYANALGIIYPPVDEDYGYVTLEAMLAAKPIITCTDSGGPLEFVRSQYTGLMTDPTPQAFALAMDQLWQQRDLAKQWGEAGRAHYDQQNISWHSVVTALTA